MSLYELILMCELIIVFALLSFLNNHWREAFDVVLVCFSLAVLLSDEVPQFHSHS